MFKDPLSGTGGRRGDMGAAPYTPILVILI